MIAVIEIECKSQKLVLDALKPDAKQQDVSKKFDVNFKASKNKIIMKVKADDISALLAGINSYMRLIRTAIETNKIE